MNQRKLGGISVCITYVVLMSICFELRELFANEEMRAFMAALPIDPQLHLADALGLLPALGRLRDVTSCIFVYSLVVVVTFYPLYWLGWWIMRMDGDIEAPPK